MTVDLSTPKILQVLEQTIAELQRQPIDLLNINDHKGEGVYLDNARPSYRRTLLDIAKSYSAKGRPSRSLQVLEIGALLGVVSISLARLGMQVTALDIPEFAANPRLQERYRQAEVKVVAENLRDYSLPFAAGQFDLVIMCETLEHLNFNPLPVMAEINRVLRSDGRLYLALPNLTSLPHRYDLLWGHSIHNPVCDFAAQLSDEVNMIVGLHWREYTRKELLEMLDMTGFSLIWHAYSMPVHAHPLAHIIYRLLPSLRPAQSLLAGKSKETPLKFHYTAASRG